MKRRAVQLGALVSLVAASLGACKAINSYATVKNQSESSLSDARWVFAESPEVIVTVGTVAAGATARIKIPSGLSETSASFLAKRGSETILADCGYLESDGHFQAQVDVLADGSAQCKVDLESF